MTILEKEVKPEDNNTDDLILHEDILSLQGDFLKHLFRVLNPSEEIEELKNYRASNEGII